MAKEGLYEKAKGRRRYDPHVRIYHYMIPAMMERLGGNAVKVLLYMLTFETGEHKGVFMGARQAAEGCGISPNTASAALVELDCQGFIRPINLGHFQVKGGPASSWRFTFLPFDGKGPTNEWRDQPLKNKSWSQNLHTTVPKIAHLGPSKPPTVPKIGTVAPVLAGHAVPKIGTQIIASTDGEASDRSEPEIDGEIAGGPIEADAREALFVMRAKVTGHWQRLSKQRRRAWAESHGITADELSFFITGDPASLPFAKVAALVSDARSAQR